MYIAVIRVSIYKALYSLKHRVVVQFEAEVNFKLVQMFVSQVQQGVQETPVSLPSNYLSR